MGYKARPKSEHGQKGGRERGGGGGGGGGGGRGAGRAEPSRAEPNRTEPHSGSNDQDQQEKIGPQTSVFRFERQGRARSSLVSAPNASKDGTCRMGQGKEVPVR